MNEKLSAAIELMKEAKKELDESLPNVVVLGTMESVIPSMLDNMILMMYDIQMGVHTIEKNIGS